MMLCLLAVALDAQSNFGTIQGRIEDTAHRTISGARVEVRAIATGAQRTTVTNDSGLFEFASLTPARYSVQVGAPGFSTLVREISVEVGQHMTLDLTLSVIERRETIAVIATAETLKTQDVSLGEVVESKSVQDLPLNGRMLVDLALTVPGAHLGHGAQTGDMSALYWRPGQRSAITIGGNRPNANYFLLDGATNTDPTFNTMNFSPSPDAVQEFQVQTGSYSAEMGGAGGGQINIITRQGTSRFHGTAYAFVRHDAIDARTWNEMPGTTYLRQNNAGASAGGPLFGKQTFFFANYERFRQTMSQTMVGTVPTRTEARGDFSDAGVTIYNPLSSHANPSFDPARPISPTNPQILRDAFPGNVIPAGLLNFAAARMVQRYVPEPNSMGDMNTGMTMMGAPTVFGVNRDSNNFLDVRDMRHRNHQGTIRVDRTFDQANTLSVRYSISKEDGFMPQNLPGFAFFHDNQAQNASAIYTRVLSPHLVNTASIAMSRLAMSHFAENSYTNDIVGQLGITGVGFGGAAGWGAPFFNVQGYSPFGDSWLATPMQAWDTLVEARDTLNWQKGRHALKFGGSVRRFIWPMWALVQSRGYYSFTSGFTTQTATNDGTGAALASFLLGLPASRQLQNGLPSMNLRQWYADGFAQDTWRLTARTTINAGLRYEYMSALVDISRNWSNLLQQDGKLMAFLGGQSGMPRGLMYPNKFRFAPRLARISHRECDRSGNRFAGGWWSEEPAKIDVHRCNVYSAGSILFRLRTKTS
jgi:carboxypeptidase family protein